MSLRVRTDYFYIGIIILLISFILDAYYYFFVFKYYDYQGFDLDFNAVKYFIGKLLIILFIVLSFKIVHNGFFIYSIYVLFLTFYFLPNVVLYSFMNFRGDIIISLFLFLLIFYFSSYIKIPTSQYVLKNGHLYILLIALIFLMPIVLNYGSSMNFKVLLLKDVYETRSSFKSNSTGLTNYLYQFEIKVIAPVLLITGLIKRNYLIVFSALGVLLYIFLLSGHKSVFFSAIVLIVFFLMGKREMRMILYVFIGLILTVAAFPVIDKLIFHKPYLQSLIVLRVFFDPALLNQYYFDFFQHKPIFYSESSFFNIFFEYPFPFSSDNMISRVYYNNPQGYANNGFISDGYMNLGYPGVILHSVIVSMVYTFFNSLMIDLKYYGIFFLSVFILISTALLASFITGGLLILIFFSIFFFKRA